MPKPLTASNSEATLVNLTLDAVALCNTGANSRAHILLNKRKENENMPQTFEELIKALTTDQANIVNAHIATLEKAHKEAVEKLDGQITQLTATNEQLAKSAKPAPTEEDVLKNAPPELAAMFSKMQDSMASMIAEREEALAKSRYEKLKAIPVPETDLKSILKTASPAVVAVLEKAATAVEAALNPVGKNTDNKFQAGNADEAYAKLEKAAKAISAERGVSFEKAFTLACTEDTTTYAAYAKGVK